MYVNLLLLYSTGGGTWRWKKM